MGENEIAFARVPWKPLILKVTNFLKKPVYYVEIMSSAVLFVSDYFAHILW